jgi:hypothetical protein
MMLSYPVRRIKTQNPKPEVMFLKSKRENSALSYLFMNVLFALSYRALIIFSFAFQYMLRNVLI